MNTALLIFASVSALVLSVMSKKVAVIGGGISGLSCAKHLTANSISAVVFDTGKNSVGGRSSARVFNGKDGSQYVFDHSSQCFTASSTAFQEELNLMIEANAAKEWNAPVRHIQNGEKAGSPDANLPHVQRYVGVEGMRSVSEYLSRDLLIERPAWVSRVSRRMRSNGTPVWDVYHNKEMLGTFDAIVIAHNGKCADKLMSTADAPLIHELLKVNFGPVLRPQFQHKRMQLCSLFVHVFAVQGALPVKYEAAVVSKSPIISWVSLSCHFYRSLHRNEDCAGVYASSPRHVKRI
jgi:predicted NAD/FAD-dependent oxidoreductase